MCLRIVFLCGGCFVLCGRSAPFLLSGVGGGPALCFLWLCCRFRGAGGIVGSFVLLTGHCVFLVVLLVVLRHDGALRCP